MYGNKIISAIGLLSLGVLVLSGCTVRTYSITRPRVDQNLQGNRGFLMGTAPEEPERTKDRTTRVIEVEFGPRGKAAEDKQVQPAQALSVPEEVIVSDEFIAEAPAVEIVAIPALEVKMEKYKVQKGDTLQKISKKFYGTTRQWTKIYEANKDKLKAPDKIYVGQMLDIPLEKLPEKVK